MLPVSTAIAKEHSCTPVTDRACELIARWRAVRRLAATVFRYRAQEGEKGRGWRGKRKWLPLSLVVKHGVENNEELAHTGDERLLCRFASRTQARIELLQGGIAVNCDYRTHVQ